MSRVKTGQIAEFGDYQTPPNLAASVCAFLHNKGISVEAIVEPTCGRGSLLFAAADCWPSVTIAVGAELNPVHLAEALKQAATRTDASRFFLDRADFFHVNWAERLAQLPDPILLVGNPPWVTNSHLSTLESANLPVKTNFQGHNGLEAVTGKSNFDISEWMLIRLLDALSGRTACLAMLCKTAVARKVLVHAWRTGIGIDWAEIRTIDANASFGAAVDACLLVCSLAAYGSSQNCGVYPTFSASEPAGVLGYCDGLLLADVAAYRRWKHLAGEEVYKWRSGVKHDCSKIMELRKESDLFRNGLGELVSLEDNFVFPMLKSSELTNSRALEPVRWMLVPQRTTGEDTRGIRICAPNTWQYLVDHGDALDRRASSIYRNRPRFSVFGVGTYTFAPWKVAISGFYKKLQFTVVGNSNGKPTVLDDTAYFVPCESEQEARLIANLLNSEIARAFYSAFIFWDAKRPITVDLLRRLDLRSLAIELGYERELMQFVGKNQQTNAQQMELFEAY